MKLEMQDRKNIFVKGSNLAAMTCDLQTNNSSIKIKLCLSLESTYEIVVDLCNYTSHKAWRKPNVRRRNLTKRIPCMVDSHTCINSLYLVAPISSFVIDNYYCKILRCLNMLEREKLRAKVRRESEV